MNPGWLAIVLGAVVAGKMIWGLARPDDFRRTAVAFPRSEPWGWVLMLLATAWFLYNLKREETSDFAAFKPLLFVGFAGVGIGACFFLKDYLAVRGAAILWMLVAREILESFRWVEGSAGRLLMVVTAYLMVLAGMWLTVSPARGRDLLGWWTGNGRRQTGLCLGGVVLGLLYLWVGFTVLRA